MLVRKININDFGKQIFKKAKFGYQTYTEDGDLLRSKLEFYFYCLLRDNDIAFEVNKKYPIIKKNEKIYYFDFYILIKNEYIEIADMSNDLYNEKMLLKEKIFGSITLKTEKDMLDYVNKLIEEIKIEN